MTEKGFVKAQSDNLPKVDSIMTCSFFAENIDFISSEIRGVKASRSSRESYGDNAVGYVQVKRDGAICTVKARISPEHKVRAKPYSVTLVCDEKEGIVESCICENCPASQGGCKHAVAFLSWVNRRSEEPPKTSIQCYWKRPKMAEIGSSVKFIKCRELGEGPPPVSDRYKSDGSFLSAVVAATKAAGVKDILLMEYFRDDEPIDYLSIHTLMESFINNNIGTTPEEFFTYCIGAMSVEACEEASNLTLEQCDSNLWHELRYGRITASRIHEAAHCRTLDGSLVENLLGATICETEAVQRGRKLEEKVFTKLKNQNPRLKRCGLILSNIHPIFGASPDGICDDYVVEIKCPSTEKWMDRYFDGNTPKAKFLAQMQLQMHFTKKKKALFCVAKPDFEKSFETVECFVDFDEKYCSELMEKAGEFWKKTIFCKLFQ